jgi:hypothetical protein
VKKDATATRQLNKERYLANLTSPDKTDLNSNKLASRQSRNFVHSYLNLAAGKIGPGWLASESVHGCI